MANELTSALYERAILAINELYKTDEVKEWINRAAAYAEYARQAKDDTMERQAKEIRIRAQRRMGELTIVMERGKRGPKTSSSPLITVVSPDPNTTNNLRRSTAGNSQYAEALRELNISSRTAREWQEMARLSPEEFERKHIEPIYHPSPKIDKFITSNSLRGGMEKLQLELVKEMKENKLDKIHREAVVERARKLMNTLNEFISIMENISPSTSIRRVK